jgi:threonine/homoserine/homoserine lactone efflux protein
VSRHSDPLPQLALLAATFLVFAVALDTCWAFAPARLRHALSLRGQLQNRLIGGFYFAAALRLTSVRRTA